MARGTADHSLEAMSSGTPSNLHHIYFFLGQPANTGHTQTSSDSRDAASFSAAPSMAQSRDGSPDSTGTKNSATLTSSASDASTVLNPHAPLFTPTSSPAKTSHSSPKKVREQVYELRQVEGKGLGLVAAASIPRGTRIICERPLLTIPDNLVHLAWKSYRMLRDWEKEEFDKLHVYEPDGMGLENTSRMFLIDHDDGSMDEDGSR